MQINNVSLGFPKAVSQPGLPASISVSFPETARSRIEGTKESDSYFEFPPLINV